MSAELLAKLVGKLKSENRKVATMESCTGGGVANAITNTSGSSEVFNFGAVTYSNDFKIKFGVNSQTIDKFSVYSLEVAKEMSKAIADFAIADYGIGITGKLKKVDKFNNFGKDDAVFVSVYDKANNRYIAKTLFVTKETREENKEMVIECAIKILLELG